MKKQWFTIFVFVKIGTRRFFRDRLALFFTVIFPLIFLFVFGGIFGKDNTPSFKVALLNQSGSQFSQQFATDLKTSKVFKVNESITTQQQADEKMKRSEIDATIVLSPEFGVPVNAIPSGQANVYYTANSEVTASTLVSVLQAQFKQINASLVPTIEPFTVIATKSSQDSLSRFDYTFAGLLGFSILGLGIFGPINVFPELKKQGILRRLHTTPLKVWQYFISNVFTQAIVGIVTITILCLVAIVVFNLKIVGNPLELAIFIALGIATILGIGLSIGGWAQNERQAAPLANIIVFPMLFLSGTFFPRYVMPEWLQGVSSYLPLTPVIDGIRLIATEGKHLTELGPQLVIMGVWAVVIYFIAFRVFRWE
ncbi:ABC transporter permease [bacterium]|nr:ABC transporter permease [bacterium]NBX98288.1 ABC transporter permease [bacterium]NDC95822.1 ABC transporter permease [bacterium]NDD85239.1 ABC transporter permease [bacterium]NDG31787.1 ABC transporter permease [bacterium]